MSEMDSMYEALALMALINRRQVVIVNPDEFDRTNEALQADDYLRSRVLLHSSLLVEAGTAITFPEPPGFQAPGPLFGPVEPPGVRVVCPECKLTEFVTLDSLSTGFQLVAPAVGGKAIVVCLCGAVTEVRFE